MASGPSNFQRGGLPYRGAPSQQIGRGGARVGGALGHQQQQQQIQQQQLPPQQQQQRVEQRGAGGQAQIGQNQPAEITDEQREEIDGAVSSKRSSALSTRRRTRA
jgi:hypothetical protein